MHQNLLTRLGEGPQPAPVGLTREVKTKQTGKMDTIRSKGNSNMSALFSDKLITNPGQPDGLSGLVSQSPPFRSLSGISLTSLFRLRLGTKTNALANLSMKSTIFSRHLFFC